MAYRGQDYRPGYLPQRPDGHSGRPNPCQPVSDRFPPAPMPPLPGKKVTQDTQINGTNGACNCFKKA